MNPKIVISIYNGKEVVVGTHFYSFKEAVDFLEEQKEKWEEKEAAKADLDTKDEF